MRNQHTRDILFLDVRVAGDPEIAPAKSIREIAVLIGKLRDSKGAVSWNRPKTRKTYIRDFEIDDDTGMIWLLLCATDAHAPGASFADLDTDEQRDEEKKEGEGRPETAHLMILQAETKDGSGEYLALLEECPSFPRAKVEKYLNFLLRTAYKEHKDDFLYPSPTGEMKRDGTPKMIQYRNSATIGGHMSTDFLADIEAGTIRGMWLETDHKASIGFGERKRLTPVRKQIKLSVSGSGWKDGPRELIGEALGMGRDNKLETARIAFVAPDNTAHTAVLDTENGTILNDGYIKKGRIDAKDLMLPEASKKFIPQLQARIAALLA
jgi:hypothetical protein